MLAGEGPHRQTAEQSTLSNAGQESFHHRCVIMKAQPSARSRFFGHLCQFEQNGAVEGRGKFWYHSSHRHLGCFDDVHPMPMGTLWGQKGSQGGGRCVVGSDPGISHCK